MNGTSTEDWKNLPRRSPQEVVDSLKRDLHSDDVERQRMAAVSVRVSHDIHTKAVNSGGKVIVEINGETKALEPNSPLLIDVSELLPIADKVLSSIPTASRLIQ